MISLFQGDILTAKTDVIVNPANSFLRHGGGLAKIIDDAAMAEFDPEPLEQWTTVLGAEPGPIRLMKHTQQRHLDSIRRWIMDHRDAPAIPTGAAHMTTAGALPFEAVIHAVGPIWGGGLYCEHALLESAYASALILAYEERFSSIAFPAISAGIFGFPILGVAQCARRAMGKVGTPAADLDVQFWLFSDEHADAFASTFGMAVRRA